MPPEKEFSRICKNVAVKEDNIRYSLDVGYYLQLEHQLRSAGKRELIAGFLLSGLDSRLRGNDGYHLSSGLLDRRVSPVGTGFPPARK